MKSKIVHLTSVHPRTDTRIFLKQCLSLSEKYNVSLVVADGLGNDIKHNIHIYDVGKIENRVKRIINSTKAVLEKAIELDADLYHLHDPELLPIGLRLKKLGKTVIFDSHEDVPNQILSKYYLPAFTRRPLSKMYRTYESYACAYFDAIVAATPYIQDKFLKINSNTVNINNYPDTSEFLSVIPDFNNSKQVFYVGSITKIRGITELVESLTSTNVDCRLKLAGSFPDKNLEFSVKKMDGWQKVEYIGFANRDEIKESLSESIAGLVTLHPTPSFVVSLPVKMFEYMSAGLPVIASDFPLWRNIIEKINCGICVNPLDPQSISKAIDYLIKNPDKAYEMGNNGRKAIIETYNWTVEKNALLALYDSLC